MKRTYNRQHQDAVNSNSRRPNHRGYGILNKLINKLPFELHIPGYQYCGPGTKFTERYSRGDLGVNELDRACKQHDFVYHTTKDLKERHKADKQLADQAWSAFKSKNSSLGEKSAAWLVTNAMKGKVKLGMGHGCAKIRVSSNKKSQKGLGLTKTKKKNNNKKGDQLPFLSRLVKSSSQAFKKGGSISDALKAAKRTVKKAGGRKNVRFPPRVIKVPKRGGIIPLLIPLLSGLSALGGLAGGAAGIATAVNKAKNARKSLEEAQRHNKAMENISLGKGLFLKPYKKGLGLFHSESE